MDKTSELIKEFTNNKFDIHLIKFSRNFGHQNAVQAGLDYCKGFAAIIIDADLQDPPNLAENMINKWENGFQVVYGKRVQRIAENKFKIFTAFLFYRLLNFLSGIPIPNDTGDFRLIDREVIDVLNSMPEKGRFIRGLISWIGFRQTSIKYRRNKRAAGLTKYSLRKMISLALEGLTNFSRRPLRLATFLGFFFSIFAFLGIIYVLYVRLFTLTWVPGWAAILLAILLSSGIQMICIGILGEYIGNIFFESKNRPLYVLSSREVIVHK
jgi:dolichol-phosphate mannosyltransferase